MRNLIQATLYPGIGAFESTNISVGRGTDTPFEQIGAPWIDGVALADALNARRASRHPFLSGSLHADREQVQRPGMPGRFHGGHQSRRRCARSVWASRLPRCCRSCTARSSSSTRPNACSDRKKGSREFVPATIRRTSPQSWNARREPLAPVAESVPALSLTQNRQRKNHQFRNALARSAITDLADGAGRTSIIDRQCAKNSSQLPRKTSRMDRVPGHAWLMVLAAVVVVTVASAVPYASAPAVAAQVIAVGAFGITPSPTEINPRSLVGAGAFVVSGLLLLLFFYRRRLYILFWVNGWVLLGVSMIIAARTYTNQRTRMAAPTASRSSSAS